MIYVCMYDLQPLFVFLHTRSKSKNKHTELQRDLHLMAFLLFIYGVLKLHRSLGHSSKQGLHLIMLQDKLHMTFWHLGSGGTSEVLHVVSATFCLAQEPRIVSKCNPCRKISAAPVPLTSRILWMPPLSVRLCRISWSDFQVSYPLKGAGIWKKNLRPTLHIFLHFLK